MISRLIEKIKKTSASTCVGLDPMLPYMPGHVVKKSFDACGETLEGAADAIWQFNKEITDHTCDLVPAVKLQIAMCEQFGIERFVAYKKTVEYCHEKGLITIGGAKWGDIGSASAAYATGHLGAAQVGSNAYRGFDVDTLMVDLYLGIDRVRPFVDVCSTDGKGLFVLVKASNPSSGEFQNHLTDGRPLCEWAAQKVME